MDETLLATQTPALDPRVEELFRVGLQFGYAKTRRHPKMKDYVAGVKNNIEIFHLEKVLENLDRALSEVESLGRQGLPMLWVGTKPPAVRAIQNTAEELGHPYIDGRWLGGTLTNFDAIRKRVLHWQDLVAKKQSGELAKYTKQEQLLLEKTMERMARTFHGLVMLTGMPKAMIVVDPKEEENAVHEALLKRIPVFALLNTDCNPDRIAYPIPGNDNATESIQYIVDRIKRAYLKGKAEQVAEAAQAAQATTNGN